jgi:hypothetical protein
MIQDVKTFPISFYFNPDGATSSFIPKYQREYVLGWSNWDALFNDLDESPSGHFWGATRTEWNEAAMTARTDKMLKEVKSILSLRRSS